MRRAVSLLAALGACLVLSASCGGGGGGGGGGSNDPGATALQFGPFPSAVRVVGQVSAFAGAPNAGGIGASTLNGPGHVAFIGANYHVTDIANHRTLGFSGVPTTDGASASFVLQQPDFTSNTSGLSATRADCPTGIATAGGKLFISEFGNHRVCVWNTVPTSTEAPASFALGQTALNTNVQGTSASNFDNPWGLHAVGTRLFVADSSNNRVLIWNTLPTSGTQPADLVLGQADFISGAANRGGSPSANTMATPVDVWSDGTRLFVADAGNHRVLVWNSFPTTNGQAADLVMGQPDFSTTTPQSGAAKLAACSSVHVENGQVFVGDFGNARVMIWDAVPTTNGAPADQVIGQQNFVNQTANDDNQDGSPDGSVGPRTFGTNLLFLTVVNGALHVSDFANNRVLIFTGT